MSVEALQFITPGQPISQLVGEPAAPQSGMPFVNWLEKELSALNDQIISSETGVRELASGQSTNLHQVMLELEKSKTSFQLVMEVRNKLLDAYQDVMRMQV